MLTQFATLCLLALPVACVSWTVTNEEIFKEFRDRLKSICSKSNSLIIKKLCYLPTCHYCFSHYVAGVFTWFADFRFLSDRQDVGYCLSLFSLVLVANVYLTLYNILRVILRWSKALADEREEIVGQLKEQRYAKY